MNANMVVLLAGSRYSMSSLLIFYRGSHGVRHNTRDQKMPYHAPESGPLPPWTLDGD